MTFTRSTLKPLQALPFVAAGGVERYRLTPPRDGAAVREPLGRAAPRRGGGVDPRQGAATRDRPPVRHARRRGFYEVRGEIPPPPPYSPLAHNCSGKHAGMLAHCVACGYGKHDYLGDGASAAAGDPRGGRDDDRRRRGRAARGHRRLLGAQLRDAAGAAGAGVCPPGCGATSTGATAGAAAAGGRDGRAAGNGVRRRPQRPGAHPRRRAATGCARSAPKPCRRSASAAAGWGIAIKVADGGRRGLLPGDDRRAGAAGAARRRRAGGAGAAGGARCCATTAALPRARCGPSLSWTIMAALPARHPSPALTRHAGTAERMNLSLLLQSVTPSARCGENPVAWAWTPGCRTCRSAGQQRMNQGLPADG